MAYTTDVDVYEVRTAIVPYSAAMQAQGGVTQLRRGNPGQANIDCFGLHMQAVLGHAGVRAARAQKFVAPGRTVAANHIDFTAGIAERRGQIVEQVEKMRIVMMHISGTVIAEKMVEFVQRCGNVLITATVDDIQPLVGVSVIEAEPVFASGGSCRFCGMPQRRQRQKKNQR